MSGRTLGEVAPRLGSGALAGYERWREAMRWQRAVDRALRPLKLTHTQLLVLHSVDVAHRRDNWADGVSQADVSREAGLDPATTGSVIRALDERDYVSRDVFGDDARAWSVIITKRGLRVLLEAAALAEQATAVASEPSPTPPRRSRRVPSPVASE